MIGEQTKSNIFVCLKNIRGALNTVEELNTNEKEIVRAFIGTAEGFIGNEYIPSIVDPNTKAPMTIEMEMREVIAFVDADSGASDEDRKIIQSLQEIHARYVSALHSRNPEEEDDENENNGSSNSSYNNTFDDINPNNVTEIFSDPLRANNTPQQNQNEITITVSPTPDKENNSSNNQTFQTVPNFNNTNNNVSSSLFHNNDTSDFSSTTSGNTLFGNSNPNLNNNINNSTFIDNDLFPLIPSSLPISSNNIPSSSSASQPNLNNVKNDNGLTIHVRNGSSKKNDAPKSSAQILANTSPIIQPVPNKTTWQTAREACETFAKSKNLIVTNSIQKEFTITHPNNQIHPITVQQSGDENSPVSISTADVTVGSTKAMLVELAKSIAAEYAKTGEAEIEIETKNPDLATNLATELQALLTKDLGANANKVKVIIKSQQEAPKPSFQKN